MRLRKFVGREQELFQLSLLIKQKKASIAVITGRRRIGKSRLIYEFCKQKNHYIFEGLAPGKAITDKHERYNFADQMQVQLGIPRPNTENWTFLLRELANRTKKGPVIIVLDEVNWLGHNEPSFLDVLKQVWDQFFSKNPKLILILSGSVSSWIHREILSDTKFLGRITLVLNLRELSLPECNMFWGRRRDRISSFEKLKILSMTGGVPRYLEEIIPEESAEQNILRLAYQPEGLLFREFDQLFRDVYSKRTNIYQFIIKVLLDGAKEPKEILAALGKSRSGTYSQYLDELVKIGFITREDTWSLLSSKISRIHRYRITDNYIRFYLQFIYPQKARLSMTHLTKLPRIESKLGFQFENLVLENRQYIHTYLNIKSDDIIMDNPFFQRQTGKVRGCQIDYLIHTKYNTLYACEIKFKTEKIRKEVIQQMQVKLKTLSVPRRFSVRPVLIHVNGVNSSLEDAEYFDFIIDFGNFLKD